MSQAGALKRPRPLAARNPWILCAAVFGFVLAVQLLLVAAIGTDVPSADQWDVEGAWFYPLVHSGAFRLADLFVPNNEHRIAWTHLLNLALFTVDGQWDPLVQLGAIAVLRAACAGLLARLFWIGAPRQDQLLAAAAVAFAFLPHLAWHSVTWGFESQVYFALGWSLLALWLLGQEAPRPARLAAGLLAGAAGLVAMAPAALVPVALVALAVLRAWESRDCSVKAWVPLWPAAALLALAWLLHAPAPQHDSLHPEGLAAFLTAAARVLAWPHVWIPLAALPLNLPLLAILWRRGTGRHARVAGEDFVLSLAFWSAAVALATAWARGGSPELVAGVPSRYVDFLVPLPLANLWCMVVLVRESDLARRPAVRLLGAAWALFLLVGWAGLSAQVARGIILPRAADRDLPVRLIETFALTEDPATYDRQPRLIVPHPNLASVSVVLKDPRMRGLMPPSLQPAKLPGPFSRAVRRLLGRPAQMIGP